MLLKKFLFLLIALSLFSFSCSKQTPISGDVFLVKGQENVKLGLIEVKAYTFEKILPILKTKEVERASRYTAYETSFKSCHFDDLSDPYSECIDKAYFSLAEVLGVYTKFLPVADARATTDADGKFSMTLPKAGKYILVANAAGKDDILDRIVGYYWFVPVTSDGNAKKIILSNNNLANPAVSPALGIPDAGSF